MDIVVSIKPVLNGVFKFLIYKTFLNYKIDCIYGSFKKKKSFLRHIAKRLQACQLQKGLSENVTLALKSFFLKFFLIF